MSASLRSFCGCSGVSMYISRYNIVFHIEGRRDSIVLNSLSRSLDLVSRRESELLDFLQGGPTSQCLSPKDIDYLAGRGYLLPSLEEEKQILQGLVEKDDREDYPQDFLLFPTFLCNLRCGYCFQNNGSPLRSHTIISRKFVDKAFESIEMISGKRQAGSRPLLYLFGGEPLLRGKRAEKILRYILSRANQENYRVGIITNGTNLEHYAEPLREFDVEFVQVTLDGPRYIHDQRRKYPSGRGTFSEISRGISSMLDSDTRILIRVNLDSQNIDCLPEFAEFVIDSGWNRDNVVAFTGPYRDLLCRSYQYQLPEHEMLRRILSFHRHNVQTKIFKLLGWPGVDYILYYLKTGTLPPPRVSYCISSYGRFCFDPEGLVYACGTGTGNRENAIGTYYPTLDFNQSKISFWRKRRFTEIPECLQCRVAPICGGGCTLQSLIKHDGNRPFCPSVLENMNVVFEQYFDEIVTR